MFDARADLVLNAILMSSSSIVLTMDVNIACEKLLGSGRGEMVTEDHKRNHVYQK